MVSVHGPGCEALAAPARSGSLALWAAAPSEQPAPGAVPAVPVPIQAPAAQTAAHAGGTLRIGSELAFADLDPLSIRHGWFINSMANVYSTLVRTGTDLLPQPDLATKWEYKNPK